MLKRITKICCHRSDTDVEQPRLVQRPLHIWRLLSREALEHFDHEILYAVRYGNTLSVMKARFLPDGESHVLVIMFDEGEGTKMSLIIDGRRIYEVETVGQIRGRLVINIDGTVVDFLWNLLPILREFLFYTREYSSRTRAEESSSRGGGESDCRADEQQEHYEHVYLLVILG